jgi:integrase
VLESDLSPVLLVSPVKETVSVFDLSAPLRVPNVKSLKLMGPKPISSKQQAVADDLVEGQLGLFGALSALIRDNQELSQLKSDLAQSLVMSKAPNTFNKYMPLVSKWQEFAQSLSKPAFPADNGLFVLYLQKLKNVATEKGTKGSAVPDTVYAVDFAHRLRGLDLPGKFEPIRLLCCAVKRSLSRPGVKKRPVTKDEVTRMIDFAVPDFSDIDLMKVRAALFAVLAFCLEARYDDLCDLRLSSFFDYGDYIVVFIEHRKTDQYREGQFVPIFDSGEKRGACAFLRAVLPLLGFGSGESSLHIFRRVGNGSKCGKYMRPEPLSYSRVRELVRDLLEGIGLNPNDHGLHSFRSGAATHAANQPDISDRQWGKHGGWADGSTAQSGYVLDSAQQALVVPKALAI